MFRCPLTGRRLIKARAGGGTLWYSTDSDGRLLTLPMVRHFFGTDKAREIWIRSDISSNPSENNCPSCQKAMRNTILPAWIGSGAAIDVCRACRVLWLEGDYFDNVPRGSQLLHPRGDSTLVKDLGEAYLEHHRIKAERKSLNEDGITFQPESTLENILAFLRLPIERSNRLTPEWPIMTAATLFIIFMLHILVTDDQFIKQFGFYPADPFKNFGLNIFVHAFIHADWFHLLSNCYFIYILSDDVEDDLGQGKFLLFLGFVMAAAAIICLFISGSRDIPHIGYSGVVMALFAYYGLQFPKAKMIWLLPGFKLVNFDKLQTCLFGWSWFQFRTLWVALFYLAGDIAYYFMSEVSNSAEVSFSGHIAGFAAGTLFWFVFAPKTFTKEAPDLFESRMDSLLPKTSDEIERPRNEMPKQIE